MMNEDNLRPDQIDRDEAHSVTKAMKSQQSETNFQQIIFFD